MENTHYFTRQWLKPIRHTFAHILWYYSFLHGCRYRPQSREQNDWPSTRFAPGNTTGDRRVKQIEFDPLHRIIVGIAVSNRPPKTYQTQERGRHKSISQESPHCAAWERFLPPKCRCRGPSPLWILENLYLWQLWSLIPNQHIFPIPSDLVFRSGVP